MFHFKTCVCIQLCVLIANFESDKAAVYTELSAIQESLGPLQQFIANPSLIDELRAQHLWTIEHLAREYNVTNHNVEQFFAYAKFIYECGSYKEAGNMLQWFRQLAPSGPAREGTEMSSWEEYRFGALWGKLACEILNNNMEVALADWTALKESIDSRVHVPQAIQLQQRVWLAHWALFVFFHTQDGLNRMLDALMGDKQLAAICSQAPHLLRYLAVAAIYNRRRKNVLNDFARTITQYRTQYTDPIIEFLHATVSEFDLEKASTELGKLPAVIAADFFLAEAYAEPMMANSKLLLFETYSRTYKHLDITSVVAKLQLDTGDAESRLVEYIRGSRLDAKIDSEKNTLVVATPHPSIYQQVIDKTKSIAWRSGQLAQQLEKRYGAARSADDRD